MLLKRLVEYADRIELPPPLYGPVSVRYIFELDRKGKPTGRPIDTADPVNPRTKRGQQMLMPNVQRASGIRPLLFADNAEYTLGKGKPASKPDRVVSAHKAYVAQVIRCNESTRDPAVGAVLRFLEALPLTELDLPGDFDPSATITFRVDAHFVTEIAAVQAFWAKEHSPSESSGAAIMQCVVCGNEAAVLDRLQAKIKGIPGGQTSGTSMISANAAAFESYGLKASLISPICSSCAERFTKAMNDLLASESNSVRIGPWVFAFWTREHIDFSFRTYISDPKPEDVKALLSSVRSGKAQTEIQDSAFYAVSLSASGGRAVVRDWLDTTVGEAQQSLAHWFSAQEITDPNGRDAHPLGLYALAMATVRESRDLSPTTPRALARSALTNAPLPSGLLYQAVRRNRAEQRVTRPRAALIKTVLALANRLPQEDRMIELDSERTEPAYLCGRLMAVLEGVQRAALPGIKSGVVDRFYGSASTAPASVFPRLLRGAQPHLAKLERDRRGAYVALQERLGDILSGVESFPKILTLEEQGLFALGYYHQRAWDRAQARSRKGLRDITSETVFGQSDEDMEDGND